MATETSTVTFLSVPGLSYIKDRNFTFLQIAFGYILGRVAIIVFLLPGYFRGEMLSAYEVLGPAVRFGDAAAGVAGISCDAESGGWAAVAAERHGIEAGD